MTGRAAIVTGRQLWRAERREARALGCQLQVRTDTTAIGGCIAYARVIAATPRARAGLRKAATNTGHPGHDAVEARQEYTDPRDTADAMSYAIHAALDLARAALAY